VGRGRLRELLARELGGEAAALKFSYSDHDKPFLDGAPLHFNLSHSDGIAALGVSERHELGVDVEFIRPLKEDIAARYFSRAEMAALAKLADDDQLEGFYRCWTRKEAVVKAIGEGLSRALDSFDVTVAKNAPASIERLEGDEARHWQLEHFLPAEGFVGAIACRTGGAPIRVTRREI
jgi:4'-phosphopantetheinyl transferase